MRARCMEAKSKIQSVSQMWGVHVISLWNHMFGITQTKNRRKTRVLKKKGGGDVHPICEEKTRLLLTFT